MRILVDADACPVKNETFKVAQRYELSVTLVANAWMRVPTEPWLDLVVVKEAGELDDADHWIVEQATDTDIIVTDDIILASRCLEKGSRVLSTRGRVFTAGSIGEALATRELMAGLREMGEITGGPKPFEKKDRSKFLQRLDEAVNQVRRQVG